MGSEAFTKSEPKKSKSGATRIQSKPDELNDTHGSISETDGGGLPPQPHAVADVVDTIATTNVTSGVPSSTPLVCAGSLPTMEGVTTSINPAILNQPSLLLEQTLEDVEEVKEEVSVFYGVKEEEEYEEREHELK